jgi:gliding motility-associated-like protein
VDGIPADDRNLVFKPMFSQVDQYHLQIFNRWGQLIFESFDVNVGWDGTYNGKLSPQDVYIYKASGRFMSGKEFRTAGNVMLVR